MLALEHTVVLGEVVAVGRLCVASCAVCLQAWAWAGVAVYAALCALNSVWFVKLVRLIYRKVG